MGSLFLYFGLMIVNRADGCNASNKYKSFDDDDDDDQMMIKMVMGLVRIKIAVKFFKDKVGEARCGMYQITWMTGLGICDRQVGTLSMCW